LRYPLPMVTGRLDPKLVGTGVEGSRFGGK
jgi:hypothetical protein